MTTRGSFVSEQAIKGREILNKYQYENLIGDTTYLFEIIYPENKIVVDYGQDEKLVLIGAIHTQTGDEYDIHNEWFEDLGFEVVKKYPKVKSYESLKKFIPDTKEGYVVKFSNGDRIKIKGEEYLKLHKLISNVSTTAIWEMLSEGRDVLELLKDVPDELYKKVKMYIRDLRYTYFSLGEYAGKTHDGFRYGKFGDKDPEPTKKEFAEFLMLNNFEPVIRAICFSMWDKKDYDKIIWKHIKPEFRRL
jgi:RNA ligase